MSETIAELPSVVEVEGRALPVWPADQATALVAGAHMALARFDDFADYHPSLVEATVAAERDPRFHDPAHLRIPAGCGNKVRSIEQWDSPAARLIHARALMLAHLSWQKQPVFADDTWASVYRTGDYCMPHSHPRSDVSVVYMLDAGEPDPDDGSAGQLSFVDPRIEYCCPIERGRVMRPLVPLMPPGTMLVFASIYVHGVNPYRGQRPRITMSWNITRERRPGRPREWAGG